ncbi:unnamed protein product [Rotaria sp. Silwood1]|nr:unnamed protein product [Rotaria sp. Silwood1]
MEAYETAQRMEHLPEMATSMGAIGLLYENQMDYDTPLNYYYEQYNIHEKALALEQNFITEQYLFIDLMQIVESYKNKGDLKMAFKFCQYKLAQQKGTLAENHSIIGYTLKMIGDISFYCEKVDKVLEYYLQALEVFKHSQTSEQFAIVICLRFIGALMLDIEKKIYSPDDPDLADSYKSIGDIYCKTKNYQKSIDYYSKALGTYRKKGD